MDILPVNFYKNPDTLVISKSLLGKTLRTKIDGHVSSGIITETEAYCGSNDKACHAFRMKKTKRTEVMFLNGGVAYIYLCYGIHHLFNIVTNKLNEPHAVLIRGIIAKEGIKVMSERAGKEIKEGSLLNGPGKLTKALGITTALNGSSLSGNHIWVEKSGIKIRQENIITTPRIGIDYAGEDAKLPYRFVIKTF